MKWETEDHPKTAKNEQDSKGYTIELSKFIKETKYNGKEGTSQNCVRWTRYKTLLKGSQN